MKIMPIYINQQLAMNHKNCCQKKTIYNVNPPVNQDDFVVTAKKSQQKLLSFSTRSNFKEEFDLCDKFIERINPLKNSEKIKEINSNYKNNVSFEGKRLLKTDPSPNYNLIKHLKHYLTKLKKTSLPIIKSKSAVKKFIKENNPNINIYEITPKQIVFEERVKLKCYQCDHYHKKPTCPPSFPSLDYKTMIHKEYKNMLILGIKSDINEKNFEEIRTQTTNDLHVALLKAEKFLYNDNNSLATSFIGGSCKLCGKSCNIICNNPKAARIPMEAIGINVVETLKKIGIDVTFPITNSLSRYGILLW